MTRFACAPLAALVHLCACSEAPAPPAAEGVRIVRGAAPAPATMIARGDRAAVASALASVSAEAAAPPPYDPVSDAYEEAAQTAARSRDPYRLSEVAFSDEAG